ncbi:MAG: AMP-binding protein, partial [Gemmatales bacterium]|nr:AMP-binding protein [Gemmatales bacterium]
MAAATAESVMIESVLREKRVFVPSAEFSQRAHIKSMDEYRALWQRAYDDPEGFWAEQAAILDWFRRWDRVLEWNEPFAKWFLGGQLNACYNCVDRHLATWRRNKVAILWEGEPGDTRTLRYLDLHREVCRFANVLKQLGLTKGDRVTIYMPLIPEAVVAMLACARIGVTHSVVFGGF